MKSIFLIVLFLIKISGMIAQVDEEYKRFNQVIIYGKDQRVYSVGENSEYANGVYFFESPARSECFEHLFKTTHQEIELLYRYGTVNKSRLLCDAYFEKGKPSGKWILKMEDNEIVGVISFKNGLLNGQTYIRCVGSKRSQITNYKDGKRIERIELDLVGDTILYYGDKQKGFSYKRGGTDLNHCFCDWHKLKKDTIPNLKVVDEN